MHGPPMFLTCLLLECASMDRQILRDSEFTWVLVSCVMQIWSHDCVLPIAVANVCPDLYTVVLPADADRASCLTIVCEPMGFPFLDRPKYQSTCQSFDQPAMWWWQCVQLDAWPFASCNLSQCLKHHPHFKWSWESCQRCHCVNLIVHIYNFCDVVECCAFAQFFGGYCQS